MPTQARTSRANLLMSERLPAFEAGRGIRFLSDAELVEERRAVSLHLTDLRVAHTHCFLSNLHAKRTSQKRPRGGRLQSSATFLQSDRNAIPLISRLSGGYGTCAVQPASLFDQHSWRIQCYRSGNLPSRPCILAAEVKVFGLVEQGVMRGDVAA